MCYHLAVGPCEIETVHCFAVVSLFGIVGTHASSCLQASIRIFVSLIQKHASNPCIFGAKAPVFAVNKHRQLADLIDAHRLGRPLVKDLVYFLHFKEMVARTQTPKLSCTSFSCSV